MGTPYPVRRLLSRPRALLILGLFAALLLYGCVDAPSSPALTMGPDPNEDIHPEVTLGHPNGDPHIEETAEADVLAQMGAELNAEVVTAHNQLGMLVFQQLLSLPESASDGKNDSVFISPISIALALGMAYNGANGPTAEAMADALQFAALSQDGLSRDELNAANLALLQALDTVGSSKAAEGGTSAADADAGAGEEGTDHSQVRLDIANSIWYRQELNFDPAFLRENEHFYRALITGLDFSAPASVDTINDWVSIATEGLIPSVVEQLDPDQIMMLINAVYFKGDWTTPFSTLRTRNMPFQLASGDTRNVPIMHQSGQIEYYADGFQAVRLPYGDDKRVAMYVFLPPANTNFHEFARNFTFESMTQTFGQFAPALGEVMLPRMDISYKAQLNDALKALGMGIAFNGGAADFSRMLPTSERNVFISDVIHQSVLKVDEEGTEAAAVTSIDVRTTSVPMYSFTFKADRPFLIAIRDDDTEALLFVGAIVDPGIAVQ